MPRTYQDTHYMHNMSIKEMNFGLVESRTKEGHVPTILNDCNDNQMATNSGCNQRIGRWNENAMCCCCCLFLMLLFVPFFRGSEPGNDTLSIQHPNNDRRLNCSSTPIKYIYIYELFTLFIYIVHLFIWSVCIGCDV